MVFKFSSLTQSSWARNWLAPHVCGAGWMTLMVLAGVASCGIFVWNFKQTPTQRALLQAWLYKKNNRKISNQKIPQKKIPKLTREKSRFHICPHAPSHVTHGRSLEYPPHSWQSSDTCPSLHDTPHVKHWPNWARKSSIVNIVSDAKSIDELIK